MKKILGFISILLVLVGFVGCTTNPIEGLTTIPVTSEQTTHSQGTEVPSTNVPTTEEVVTEIPTTEENTSLATTELPTTRPTTEAPTTEVVTTEVPTTEYINKTVEINLFSINDFHGGAYAGIDMISNVGAYLKNFTGHKIALSNGDMFQGTAISNYYQGRVVVDGLNEGGFDGFIIGNHEFDWGIDLIGTYKDGDQSNGEFNHPVLAANIVYEDTQSPLDFTIPYIIQEFEGIRVGVIGMIGLVMDSIAASKTVNIEFLDPILTAGFYAKELREEQGVDIVVVYIHDGSGYNDEYAELTGSSKIDAVFNGHSHRTEASEIKRSGLDMPYGQTNSSKTSLAHIQLTYDRDLAMVTTYTVTTILNSNLYNSDSTIDDIIAVYENNPDYLAVINEVLTNVKSTYFRSDLSEWGASVIRDYAGVDIGATNAGGFRTSMYSGQLTVGDFMTIYPFDNVIKTSRMTGQQITDFYYEIEFRNGGDVVFDDGLSYRNDILYINDVAIVLDQYYTVGAVDYIFDKEEYDFVDGIGILQTDYFMRDLLIDDLRNASNGFDPNLGTSFPGN